MNIETILSVIVILIVAVSAAGISGWLSARHANEVEARSKVDNQEAVWCPPMPKVKPPRKDTTCKPEKGFIDSYGTYWVWEGGKEPMLAIEEGNREVKIFGQTIREKEIIWLRKNYNYTNTLLAAIVLDNGKQNEDGDMVLNAQDRTIAMCRGEHCTVRHDGANMQSVVFMSTRVDDVEQDIKGTL